MINKRNRCLTSTLFKTAIATLIVLVPMSIRPGPVNEALAYTAGPTGWCTDYSGRNYRCKTGGGSSSGGGGGCAHAAQQQRIADAEARETADYTNRTGVKLYKKRDYAAAAASFEIALSQVPDHVMARKNLGNALNMLGVEASKRGDYINSLLYYERALENRDTKQIRKNIAAAKRDIGNGGKKTCQLCARAIISDVGYGLNSSAEFSYYTSQAINNFNNCRRHISGGCNGTRGHSFRQQLADCNKFFRTGGMPAYKSCVHRTYLQAR